MENGGQVFLANSRIRNMKNEQVKCIAVCVCPPPPPHIELK
jgi:hypothetical protein